MWVIYRLVSGKKCQVTHSGQEQARTSRCERVQIMGPRGYRWRWNLPPLSERPFLIPCFPRVWFPKIGETDLFSDFGLQAVASFSISLKFITASSDTIYYVFSRQKEKWKEKLISAWTQIVHRANTPTRSQRMVWNDRSAVHALLCFHY